MIFELSHSRVAGMDIVPVLIDISLPKVLTQLFWTIFFGCFFTQNTIISFFDGVWYCLLSYSGRNSWNCKLFEVPVRFSLVIMRVLQVDSGQIKSCASSISDPAPFCSRLNCFTSESFNWKVISCLSFKSIDELWLAFSGTGTKN